MKPWKRTMKPGCPWLNSKRANIFPGICSFTCRNFQLMTRLVSVGFRQTDVRLTTARPRLHLLTLTKCYWCWSGWCRRWDNGQWICGLFTRPTNLQSCSDRFQLSPVRTTHNSTTLGVYKSLATHILHGVYSQTNRIKTNNKATRKTSENEMWTNCSIYQKKSHKFHTAFSSHLILSTFLPNFFHMPAFPLPHFQSFLPTNPASITRPSWPV